MSQAGKLKWGRAEGSSELFLTLALLRQRKPRKRVALTNTGVTPDLPVCKQGVKKSADFSLPVST